jgi:hypothetical protein
VRYAADTAVVGRCLDVEGGELRIAPRPKCGSKTQACGEMWDFSKLMPSGTKNAQATG